MNSNACVCSIEGYSPDCPLAFYQNGEMYHTLSHESRLKPRQYMNSNPVGLQKDNKQSTLEERKTDSLQSPITAFREPKKILGSYENANSDVHLEASNLQIPEEDDENVTDRPDIPVSQNHSINGPHQSDRYVHGNYGLIRRDPGAQENVGAMIMESKSCLPKPLFSAHLASRSEQSGKTKKFVKESEMMNYRHTSLRKFEPLTVGGQELTEMSIGGYPVDLAKAAQKAGEVAPLPPSRLPVIFADHELNFYHHFFQGIEIMMGRELVEFIAAEKIYKNDHSTELVDLISRLIEEGYKPSDNEITIFSKKVLISTFEMDDLSQGSRENTSLVVAANLWGFQYIEAGMQCKESDLKMWLSMCHGYYKTVWFNAFKSAGVPSFALHGVQTRYEHGARDYNPSKNIESGGTTTQGSYDNHLVHVELQPEYRKDDNAYGRKSHAYRSKSSRHHRKREF